MEIANIKIQNRLSKIIGESLENTDIFYYDQFVHVLCLIQEYSGYTSKSPVTNT
jgi:hypothetical protein